jgi:hypothetical protein
VEEPELPPEGRFAAPHILRRVEWLTLGYTLLAAAAFLARERRAGALVLTLLGLATIVGFRSLQGLVAGLHATETGRVGWRSVLLFLLRASLLGGAVLAAVACGSENILAWLAGVSALPAALLTEGMVQLVLSLRERDSNG